MITGFEDHSYPWGFYIHLRLKEISQEKNLTVHFASMHYIGIAEYPMLHKLWHVARPVETTFYWWLVYPRHKKLIMIVFKGIRAVPYSTICLCACPIHLELSLIGEYEYIF